MYYDLKLDTHIFPTRATIHIQPLVKESAYLASRAKHFRYFRCRLLTIILIEMTELQAAQRFVTITEGETEEFIDSMKNSNTTKKKKKVT